MRRTSLVLAVVVAMVTVLVFAAPAFAVSLPDNALPPGPSAGESEGIADEAEPPVEECVGDLATDTAFHTIEAGGPPDYHVIESIPEELSPGDLVKARC